MTARKSKPRKRAGKRVRKAKLRPRKRAAKQRSARARKQPATKRAAKAPAAKRRGRPLAAKARTKPAIASAPPAAVPAKAPASPHATALAVLQSEPSRAGVVRHYFPRAGAALVALEAPLATGDRIHVRGSTSDFLAQIGSLRVAGARVASADAGEVTLALPERARRGDTIYALRARV
ncbi:MAG TPA: hypothetical protein VII78_10525 [Myxococcota bacterium]|jgi:hypothetical protein